MITCRGKGNFAVEIGCLDHSGSTRKLINTAPLAEAPEASTPLSGMYKVSPDSNSDEAANKHQ